MTDTFPETPLGSPPNPVPLRDRINAGQQPIRLSHGMPYLDSHAPDPPDARDHLLEERNALARRGEFLQSQLAARDATIAALNAQLNEAAIELLDYRRALADLHVELAQRDTRDVAAEPAGQWAIVELMGHRTAIGNVTEVTIAGKPMLQVLRMDGVTQSYAPDSLYCLTPCTREQADAADRAGYSPGLPHGLRAIAAAAVDDEDDPYTEAGHDYQRAEMEREDRRNKDHDDIDDPDESGGPF